MNRLLASSNYLLIVDKSTYNWEGKKGGGGGLMSTHHAYLSLRFALGLLHEGVLLALSCQAIREVFIN